MIGDIGLVKPYKYALLLINAVDFSTPVGLDACDQEVGVVARSSLS
jgi:hypothetical protein